jgi:hypothetical protein
MYIYIYMYIAYMPKKKKAREKEEQVGWPDAIKMPDSLSIGLMNRHLLT